MTTVAVRGEGGTSVSLRQSWGESRVERRQILEGTEVDVSFWTPERVLVSRDRLDRGYRKDWSRREERMNE